MNIRTVLRICMLGNLRLSYTFWAPKESASVCAGLKTPARGPGSLVLSVRLQYSRALALLRAPIWQSFWREAARLGARLAQTCLAFRLPPQEGAV